MDFKTKRVLVFLIILLMATSLVGLWTPWRWQYMISILVVLLIAGVLFWLFLLISKIFQKKMRQGLRFETIEDLSSSAEIWSVRPMIIFLIAIGVEFLWLWIMIRFGLFWAGELGYYIFLLIFGYTLSRWGHAKQYAAILAPVLLLLLLAAWETISFVLDPTSQFQYGPEIVIFAASQMAGKLTMLPLDTVTTWGAWHLAEITQRPKIDPRYLQQLSDSSQ